jgi:hypothetical protein
MDREKFEQEVFGDVQNILAGALPGLIDKGVDIGELEIVRSGEGGNYESELRIYAYRGGQLSDALEVHVWRDGRPAATPEELRQWFRAQLVEFG